MILFCDPVSLPLLSGSGNIPIPAGSGYWIEVFSQVVLIWAWEEEGVEIQWDYKERQHNLKPKNP